jgi:hypothetical protein
VKFVWRYEITPCVTGIREGEHSHKNKLFSSGSSYGIEKALQQILLPVCDILTGRERILI